jgi:hypothetical protein
MTRTLADIPILDVWWALGGPELRHNRGRAFWRDGDGLNVSLDPDRNLWHDFVTQVGGGVLKLVQTVLGVDKAGALRWLEEQGFLEPRGPVRLSAWERAERQRRRDEEKARKLKIECYRLGALEAADNRAAPPSLLAALTAVFRDLAIPRVVDEAEAESWGISWHEAVHARAAWILSNGTDSDIDLLYQEHHRRDPQGAAALVKAGAAWPSFLAWVDAMAERIRRGVNDVA